MKNIDIFSFLNKLDYLLGKNNCFNPCLKFLYNIGHESWRTLKKPQKYQVLDPISDAIAEQLGDEIVYDFTRKENNISLEY